MDSYEAAVATYLTIDGTTFIAPQYAIAFEPVDKTGGTCPDFVALDFRRKDVVVVEVSSSASLGNFMNNITKRQERWYIPLKQSLTTNKIIDDSWRPIRYLGIIRDEFIRKTQGWFASDSDVFFYALEQVSFPWRYWDARIKNGIPGAHVV